MSALQSGRLWAVVLDGADSPFAEHFRTSSSLPRALERARLAFEPRNTIVVGTRSIGPRLALETATFPGNVLVSPATRGSAPLLLWPVYWIHRFDPDAVVVSIPADQSVREERLLMDHVARVASRIPSHPRWIVVIGAPSPDPDSAGEWIVRAESLDEKTERVWRVREVTETAPSGTPAHHGLRSTRVFVGRAEAFIDAARACLPDLHAAFSEASRWAGSWNEAEALERAYEQIAQRGFLAALQEAGFPRLAASCLPALDWGNPVSAQRPAASARSDAGLRDIA